MKSIFIILLTFIISVNNSYKTLQAPLTTYNLKIKPINDTIPDSLKYLKKADSITSLKPAYVTPNYLKQNIVPYTGATKSIDLGDDSLTTSGLTVNQEARFYKEAHFYGANAGIDISDRTYSDQKWGFYADKDNFSIWNSFDGDVLSFNIYSGDAKFHTLGTGLVKSTDGTLSNAVAGTDFLITEADPTIPAYAKSLTGFSTIKSSTDSLYYPLASNPAGFLTPATATNFVPYTGATKNLTTTYGISAANIISTNDATINSLTLGAGPVPGLKNVVFGYQSLSQNISGNWNTAFGYLALSSITTGYQNSAFGYEALKNATTGSAFCNTVMGSTAGYNITTAGYNTLLGYRAGWGLTLGYDNVFIGARAGDTETTVKNKLIIGSVNGDTGVPQTLLHGDFVAHTLNIKGTLAVDTGYNFVANGHASYNAPKALSPLDFVYQQKLDTIIRPLASKQYVDSTAIAKADSVKGTIVSGVSGSGTTNFLPKFTSTSSLGNSLIFDDGTNVGIGTTTPNTKLDIRGLFMAGGQEANLDPDASSTGDISYLKNSGRLLIGWNMSKSLGETDFIANPGVGTEGGYAFYNMDNAGTLLQTLRIKQTGNIGIGVDNPDAKLAVNGTVHSKEVLVSLTDFPDYVFKPAYHLPTLTEVKTYIDQNHHLPDMPTEDEVVKNGLKVGETEALLTKKVEELTLYLIEKDKQFKQQETRLKRLEAQFKAQANKPKPSTQPKSH